MLRFRKKNKTHSNKYLYIYLNINLLLINVQDLSMWVYFVDLYLQSCIHRYRYII